MIWTYTASHLIFSGIFFIPPSFILMFYYHPLAGQISGKKVAPIYHKEQYNCET